MNKLPGSTINFVMVDWLNGLMDPIFLNLSSFGSFGCHKEKQNFHRTKISLQINGFYQILIWNSELLTFSIFFSNFYLKDRKADKHQDRSLSVKIVRI